MTRTLIVDLVNKANLVHNLFLAYLFLVYKYTKNKYTKNKYTKNKLVHQVGFIQKIVQGCVVNKR